MTDWLPWGFVFMAGTFITLHFTLKALSAQERTRNLKMARAALLITAVLSAFLFALYLIYGESWVWYLR